MILFQVRKVKTTAVTENPFCVASLMYSGVFAAVIGGHVGLYASSTMDFSVYVFNEVQLIRCPDTIPVCLSLHKLLAV